MIPLSLPGRIKKLKGPQMSQMAANGPPAVVFLSLSLSCFTANNSKWLANSYAAYDCADVVVI